MNQISVALDFCISHRLVKVLYEMYGHEGYKFLHLQDLSIRGNTPDPQWADRYKQFGGRIVISGDCQIAYKPHLARAFIDNGLVSFFLAEPWSTFTRNEQAATLLFWWPSIATKIKAAEDGTCWRIPCEGRSGDVRLRAPELIPLVIPDHVLARKQIRA